LRLKGVAWEQFETEERGLGALCDWREGLGSSVSLEEGLGTWEKRETGGRGFDISRLCHRAVRA